MSAPHSFGRHAARLATAGYDVIPITRVTDRVACPGKQPAQPEGWQRGCPRDEWHHYADCGVGILTRNTPALDVDVLDEALAVNIADMAAAKLGDAPYRVGLPPKRLLPYRLEREPFKKIKLTWWGLGHERHTPDRPPAVELLADGQQFVSIGVHPGTGRPYRWHRDPFLSIPHQLLPPLNYQTAARFMRALAGALERLGATEIRLRGIPAPARAETVSVTEVCGQRRTSYTLPEGSDVERIRAALDHMGNPGLHYDEWIRIGHAIKAALPGPDGLALWEAWSAKSSKNNPTVTRAKWATFNPERIGAGTIFWEAAR